MSKYFIPVEIDRKWWVVENAPEEKDFIDDGQDFYIMRYYAALESCTKYPTLESDSAYWASKAGVKMTSEEFNLELVKSKMVDYLEYTAIPLQSPTTKELIEQEAGKPIIIEAYNDDGTHSHWRLIDPATGDLLWTQSPEEDTHLWTGKVPFTTFALSLPKQDNGDAWDEAIKAFEDETPDYKNLRLDIYIQHLYVYIRSNYSISKIK